MDLSPGLVNYCELSGLLFNAYATIERSSLFKSRRIHSLGKDPGDLPKPKMYASSSRNPLCSATNSLSSIFMVQRNKVLDKEKVARLSTHRLAGWALARHNHARFGVDEVLQSKSEMIG
jgi:hypothetical protein